MGNLKERREQRSTRKGVWLFVELWTRKQSQTSPHEFTCWRVEFTCRSLGKLSSEHRRGSTTLEHQRITRRVGQGEAFKGKMLSQALQAIRHGLRTLKIQASIDAS